MSDGRIVLEAEPGKRLIEVYRGVPQGSIRGPKLWYIFYGDLLRLDLPQIVFTVTAKTEDEFMIKRNAVLTKVEEWIAGGYLELAPNKSECVNLSHKNKMQSIQFELIGSIIKPAGATNYLGVWLGLDI